MRMACSRERAPLSYALQPRRLPLPRIMSTARRSIVPFLFICCVVIASLADCGGNGLGTAFGDVGYDTLVFYAFNHSGPNSPSGFSLTDQQAVTTDGSENFDVAFDLSPTGQTIIYPIKLLITGSGIGTPHQVGLKTTAQLYDSTACVKAGLPADLPNPCYIVRAPLHGYAFDTTYGLTPGVPIIIAASTAGCAGQQDPVLYAKLVVDSVNVPQGLIFARATVDPNCGYRSFLPGIPTD
jgi:hypothetical protein